MTAMRMGHWSCPNSSPSLYVQITLLWMLVCNSIKYEIKHVTLKLVRLTLPITIDQKSPHLMNCINNITPRILLTRLSIHFSRKKHFLSMHFPSPDQIPFAAKALPALSATQEGEEATDAAQEELFPHLTITPHHPHSTQRHTGPWTATMLCHQELWAPGLRKWLKS